MPTRSWPRHARSLGVDAASLPHEAAKTRPTTCRTNCLPGGVTAPSMTPPAFLRVQASQAQAARRTLALEGEGREAALSLSLTHTRAARACTNACTRAKIGLGEGRAVGRRRPRPARPPPRPRRRSGRIKKPALLRNPSFLFSLSLSLSLFGLVLVARFVRSFDALLESCRAGKLCSERAQYKRRETQRSQSQK